MIQIIIERLSLSGEIHWLPVYSLQSIDEINEFVASRENGYDAIPIGKRKELVIWKKNLIL